MRGDRRHEVWTGILLSVSAVLAAVPADADVFEVPVVTGEAARVVPSEGLVDFSDRVGEWRLADPVPSVLVLPFDLAFLPPGSTVSSATLHLSFLDAGGDVESLGSLKAGVIAPRQEFSRSPCVQAAWVGEPVLGEVDVEGDLVVGGSAEADLTQGVKGWMQDAGADQGRLLVRLRFSNGSSDNGSYDVLRPRVIREDRAWLEVSAEIPDPMTGRPARRMTPRVLPVVAENEGQYGTRWVTELAIVNGESHPASVWLYFTPTGEDGTSAFTVRRVDLSPGESRGWDDVVGDLFGLHGVKGWIEAFTTADGVVLAARVANVGGEGSYGQTVPVAGPENLFVRASSRLGAAYTRSLPLVRLEDGVRNNIGFVNIEPYPVTVGLTLRFPDGEWAHEVAVPAMGHVQLSSLTRIDPALAGRGRATAVLRPSNGPAGIVAYLSRVDNVTGDAIFVLAR